ncbi:hypothetical protein ACQY1Q_00230 [Tenacibaculum sp. TC6]|uniref:hypothetical protein n=1 Tax=Tenacibaculum sp. TC6 TaxID=3423223 RepID=UPI003D362E63
MKKLSIFLLFSMLTLTYSCSSEKDTPLSLTCEEAEDKVKKAFTNAIELNTVEACNEYKEAVLNQSGPCGYNKECIQNLLEEGGTSCIDTGSGILIGSGIVINDGSFFGGCNQ